MTPTKTDSVPVYCVCGHEATVVAHIAHTPVTYSVVCLSSAYCGNPSIGTFNSRDEAETAAAERVTQALATPE